MIFFGLVKYYKILIMEYGIIYLTSLKNVSDILTYVKLIEK